VRTITNHVTGGAHGTPYYFKKPLKKTDKKKRIRTS